MNFTTYQNFKNEIYGIIFEIKKLAVKYNYLGLVSALDNLYARLKNETFTISFIGEIKRGKSTLINALLGKEILPKSALICTSVLCIIKYILEPYAKVVFNDNSYKEINIDDLKFWVTKKNQYSNRIAFVEIGYPLEILSQGVIFVDTPGVNDTDEIRRKITEEFIPNSDGIVFVLNIGQPLTDTEMKFLHSGILKHHMKKLWFVVNAVDKVNDEKELDEILNYLYKNISEILPNPKIFGVSAKFYLESIKSKNENLKQKSKVSEFLEHLSSDIISNKWHIIIDMPLYLLGNYIKELERSLNWELQTVSQDLQTKKLLEQELINKCNNFIIKKNCLYDEFCLEIEAIIYEISQMEIKLSPKSYVSVICLILQQPELVDEEVEKQLSQLLQDQIQLIISDLFDKIKEKIGCKANEYFFEIQNLYYNLDIIEENKKVAIEHEEIIKNFEFSKAVNSLKVQNLKISNILDFDFTSIISKFAPVLSIGFAITGNWLYAALSISPILIKKYTLEKAPQIVEKFELEIKNAIKIIKQNLLTHKKEIAKEIAKIVFSNTQCYENIINDIISRTRDKFRNSYGEVNKYINDVSKSLNELKSLIVKYYKLLEIHQENA